MCPACFLLRLWSENPRAALSLTASVNVGIKRVSCTLWKKLDKPAWCIHRVDLTGNLSFSQTKTAFLKILQAALHGARQIRSWLECDSDFFLLFYEPCDWWFRRKIALSLLKAMGFPLSPFWMPCFLCGLPSSLCWTVETAKPSVTLYFHQSAYQRGRATAQRDFQLLSQTPICSTGQV